MSNATPRTDPFNAHFSRPRQPAPPPDSALRQMPREPIAQRLTAEREKPAWAPGHDVGMAAWQAGRIAILAELLRDIDAAQSTITPPQETP